MKLLAIETHPLTDPHELLVSVTYESGWWFWRRTRKAHGNARLYHHSSAENVVAWRPWFPGGLYLENSAAERVGWWATRAIERKVWHFRQMTGSWIFRWKAKEEAKLCPPTTF
jgi:hypothetical protein